VFRNTLLVNLYYNNTTCRHSVQKTRTEEIYWFENFKYFTLVVRLNRTTYRLKSNSDEYTLKRVDKTTQNVNCLTLNAHAVLYKEKK
jgi:hypothetical protein